MYDPLSLYHWILKVIDSCNSLEQTLNCKVLIKRYLDMFSISHFYYDLLERYETQIIFFTENE